MSSGCAGRGTPGSERTLSAGWAAVERARGRVGELGVVRDRGVFRVAEVLHNKGEVRCLLGGRGGVNEGTYGEDVHGGLHDDIEALASLRVDDGAVAVAALGVEDDLEHVRDTEVAPPTVFVRHAQVRLRQVQVLPERPRAEAHEVQHNLPDIVVWADHFMVSWER